jgi:hypothetical protein
MIITSRFQTQAFLKTPNCCSDVDPSALESVTYNNQRLRLLKFNCHSTNLSELFLEQAHNQALQQGPNKLDWQQITSCGGV